MSADPSPPTVSALRHCPSPGVTLAGDGVDVAVHASHATAVWLCLVEGDDPDAAEIRLPLPQRSHGWWFGHVAGVGAGQRYGFRVDGPWEPQAGHRHNPAKFLLDPYGRAVVGEVDYRPAVYGHQVDDSGAGDPAVMSELDSLPAMPRNAVMDPAFDWGGDVPPDHDLDDALVYEVHVKEFTQRLPGVPEELRGTYAGLAHPAAIERLHRLGVTTLELLPVQAFAHEPELVHRGLTNHWGYNTMGFFAPHLPFASTSDPQGALEEFKGMVRLLHEAGLEVMLDVVYNHTAEQSTGGATLSWRGLDAVTYYRLDEHGRDVDVTGCGNTLDLTQPAAQRMVLDSLRYWVQEVHVDGFRFDLAVALARAGDGGYSPEHSFLMALRTDPVLSQVKLIAEPWDVGPDGWRTGQFPEPFSEWNDRYRDAVRTFWLSDPRALTAGATDSTGGHGVRELATRLAGSEDLFAAPGRGPQASINFVTAHDGFTLADLTAYDAKHNEANGEDNHDGSDDNRSWNHGAEGHTEDQALEARRRRSMRNILGTLMLSTGVPMLASGDEIGRTTSGNNNPYCQDNALTWLDWDLAPWQTDLAETTGHLADLRRALPTIHQRRFYTGSPVSDDGSTDIAWYDEAGQPMGDQWRDDSRRILQMYLAGAHLGLRSALVIVNGGIAPAAVTLPAPPGATGFVLEWDSAWDSPDGRRTGEELAPGSAVTLTDLSLRLYSATDPS